MIRRCPLTGISCARYQEKVTPTPTAPSLDELRRRTSEKWRTYPDDVLPLFVAEMDFTLADVVADAITARVRASDIGYAGSPGRVGEVFSGFAQRRWGWQPDPAGVRLTTDVSVVIVEALRVLISPGDAVIINPPVYPPFFDMVPEAGGRVVEVPLISDDAGYRLDVDGIGQAFADGAKALLLCSPHNPVGRVFDADELRGLADFAARHDLLVCSDEIHCGLVLDADRPHRPLAALDEATARRTITLMAPSKTWNIPALYCAFAIIPDAALRRRYVHAMRGVVPHVNVLGMVAAEAAYRDGDAWRQALLDYLRGNRERVLEAVAAMPGLSATRPEATYLAWIDCREMMAERGVTDPAAFFEAAGVGLSDGTFFGAPGFVRLNFGCPRATLDAALARMAHALGA